MVKRVDGRSKMPVGGILGTSTLRLWGLFPQERARRSLNRAGVEVVDMAVLRQMAGASLLLRGDWVYDEALIRELAARPGTVLTGDGGQPVAAHVEPGDREAAVQALEGAIAPDDLPAHLVRVDAVGLIGSYNVALRKREAPLLARVDADSVAGLERRLFDGSYKGVTDAVTKYVWPAPARLVTRWCAQAGITPNQVTLASLVMVIGAFAAFWYGHFAIGLVLAWIMTFLDTVDGKLARVTLTSTPFGNVFDHGIDLVHPPFWWWAWIVGLGAALGPDGLVLVLIVGGYVMQRIEEGLFIRLFGIEMHIWQRFDSLFRLVTARRNPNLLILTVGVLLNEADDGIVLVAAWTVICLAVHALRIVQAWAASRQGPLVSWLAR